jgi:hypothetical protein
VPRGQRDGSLRPYSRFLDQSRYFFFQVAPQLHSRGWVHPVPDPLLLRKSGSAGNRTQSSGSVTRNSDHLTTEAVTQLLYTSHIKIWKLSKIMFSQSQSQSYFATDSQSVSTSWCRARFWDFWPEIFFFFFFVGLVPRCYNRVNDWNHLWKLWNSVYCSAILESFNLETMHFWTYVLMNYLYYPHTRMRNSFLKLCCVLLHILC